MSDATITKGKERKEGKEREWKRGERGAGKQDNEEGIGRQKEKRRSNDKG